MFIFSTLEGRMGFHQKQISFLFQACLLFVSTMLPLVSSFQEHKQITGSHSSYKENSLKTNPRLQSEVILHGFLLWASMGFLMPAGILAIRLSIGEGNGRRHKIIFCAHAVLQMLAVLLATAGAIMSIKNFNNSFNNNHQRVGVALYGIIWLQFLVGIFRPGRGSRRRGVWFFLHWITGTLVSFLGILNVYTGLQAYQEKTSKSARTWFILFTAQMSLIVFIYLFQDKWVYIQTQGVALGNELLTPTRQEICQGDKELRAESC